jgi:hypothetical protein
LSDHFDPFSDHFDPFSDHIDSSSDLSGAELSLGPRDEFRGLIQGMEECINHLFRLSAVLHSATRGISWDTTSYRITDEDGNDIDDAFTSYALQRVKLKYPTAQERIIQILAGAITQRRRGFLMRQEVQKRLRAQAITGSNMGQSRGKARRVPGAGAAGLKDDIEAEEAGPELKLPFTNPNTEAKAPELRQPLRVLLQEQEQGNSAIFQSVLDISSVTTTDTTGSGYHEHVISLPPIPNVPTGSREVECPYCFQILFEKDLTGRRWREVSPHWTLAAPKANGIIRRHVFQDLRPYVCLLPGCANKDDLFASRAEWFQHMRWEHDAAAVRDCCLCGGTFNTADELRSHFETDHNIPHPPFEVIYNASRGEKGPADPFDRCPLCDFEPDIPHTKAFQKHIGGHLEVMALISLPWVSKDATDSFQYLDSDVSRNQDGELSSWNGSDGRSLVSRGRREIEWGFALHQPDLTGANMNHLVLGSELSPTCDSWSASISASR